MIQLKNGMTFPPLQIELVVEGDLGFIRHLRNSCSNSFFNTSNVTEEQQQQWFKKIQVCPHIQFYVIRVEGIRVGTVSLIEQGDKVEISNLMLIPPMHGNGIMTTACKLLMKPGKKYTARVKSDNTKSLAVFTRLGFCSVTHFEKEL